MTSARVRTPLTLLMPALARTGRSFWNHPELGVLYPRYLAAVHTVIRASVPLMEEALAATRASHLDTPLGPPLAAYLAAHIPEEMHHDDWILDDLVRLGLPRSAGAAHPPSPTVAAMVGAQYYYIRHVHPVILLGYIAVLEGYPPTEDLVASAVQRSGHPVEAFRTLRKHSHLDPHHRKDLDELLDALPIEEGLLDLVAANALRTMDHQIQLVGEIVAGEVSSLIAGERP